MKKQQIKDLENEIGKIFTKSLKEECHVSMSVTGRMKISVGESLIIIDIDNESVNWVRWDGNYYNLKWFIEQSILTIRQNKDIIQTLDELIQKL